jgi:hypothetical protein
MSVSTISGNGIRTALYGVGSVSDLPQTAPNEAEDSGPETEPAWLARLQKAKREADAELRRIHRETQEKAARAER